MKNSKIMPIYSRLGDEESCYIFETRLCYSHDYKRMVNNINKKSNALKKLLEINKKFFMFGAGYWGHFMVDVLPKIKWQAFIDDDSSKVGNSDILPIISFQEFIANSENAMVFIPFGQYFNKMRSQLIDNGFLEEFIINTADSRFIGIQYFDLPYFKPNKNEFFIDAGGFDGNTTKDFFQWQQNNGGSVGKSIIFEPNPIQYDVCKSNMQNYNNVKVVNKGLWHKEETLKFRNNLLNPGGSRINIYGDEIIKTVSLDEYLKDETERVTFIKMDVEGAELNALKGAERIIREQKPKLAISIYHKPEDVWEIPSLLLNFVSDYKFYIRHYRFNNWETVLYALPS